MLPTLDGRGPLHNQLYRWLRRNMLEGRLPAGERVPPSRVLAQTLTLSRNTVLHAYERLIAEGYLVAHRGAGTFVARGLSAKRKRGIPPSRDDEVRLSRFARRAQRDVPAHYRRPHYGDHSDRGTLDFQYGEPLADAASWRTWKRYLSRRVPDTPSVYPPVQGLPRLREAIADFLWRRRGMHVDASRVVIVNGSQQALDLIARVLLEPGDPVALESPSYPGARLAFATAGAKLLPCAVDKAGLRTAALPSPDTAVRLAYVTPSHQFPTGALLPLERRLELLEWAARSEAFVVEDDYDSDYVFLPRPLEAVHALDTRDLVIYVATFAKVLSPALRLGYAVLPQRLLEPVIAAKCIADRGCALPEQSAMADFIENGDLDRHIRRTQKRLDGRRQALLRALERELGTQVRVSGAHAGMHLVVWFPHLAPDRLPALCKMAAAKGTRVYPLTPYHIDAKLSAGVLLGYATLAEAEIMEGVRRLAQAYGAV